MGIEKSELKIDMAKNIGQHYAALIKESNDEILRCEGEKRAYLQAAEALNPILARVDQDLKASAFDGITEPVVFAKKIKDYLVLVISSLESLKSRAEVGKIHSLGNVHGLVKASEFVQRIAESEQGKLQAALDAVSGNPSSVVFEDSGGLPEVPRQRPSGTRPGLSIAAQRRAEVSDETPIVAAKAKAPNPEPIITPTQLPSLKKGSRVIKSGGPGSKTRS